MNLHITETKALTNYRLHTSYSAVDKRAMWICLENLQARYSRHCIDDDLFSRVEVHSLFHTVTWPNGADLAPEFLLDLLQHQQGIAV